MVDKFGRELKRILRANGCTFVRPGKGDHEIWHSPISGRNFTVEFRGHGIPGTQYEIDALAARSKQLSYIAALCHRPVRSLNPSIIHHLTARRCSPARV